MQDPDDEDFPDEGEDFPDLEEEDFEGVDRSNARHRTFAVVG